ncbi:MAG: hypothetical protein JWM99_1249 [Verrucomicrobiales bacterium]|nr:hypothetical protein [Verrucomicrobiales bacterium]
MRLDVNLKPGSSPLATVLSPAGKPVTGADVGLLVTGAGLRLAPGRFLRNSGDGRSLLKTDQEGRFRFTIEDKIRQVVVASEQGYTAVPPESLRVELPSGMKIKGMWKLNRVRPLRSLYEAPDFQFGIV